jgi:hypothetical protein
MVKQILHKVTNVKNAEENIICLIKAEERRGHVVVNLVIAQKARIMIGVHFRS